MNQTCCEIHCARTAEAGLYRAHWSQEILDGVTRNLIARKILTPFYSGLFRRSDENLFPRRNGRGSTRTNLSNDQS